MSESPKLTDRYVGAYECPRNRDSIVLRDPVTPGLTLYVSRKGTKTWRYVYRFMGMPQQTVTLGRWPDVKASVAREMVEEYERKKALGHDPMLRGKPVAPTAAPVRVATVGEVLALHVDSLEDEDNRKRVAGAFKPLTRFANQDGVGTVADFDGKVFKTFLESRYADRPGAARFLIRNVTAAFNRAMRSTSDLQFPPGYQNPASRITPEISFLKKHRVKSHSEGWEEEKYRAFFQGVEKAKADPRIGVHGVAIIELLALTGARPSEICSLREDEIVGDFIEKAQHKTANRGGERRIVLTDDALEVIERVREHNKVRKFEGPWLFPQRRKQKNQKKPYVTSTERFAEIISEHAGIEFTPYTLRGAYVSFMLDLLGYEALDTVAANVGHADPMVTLKHYRRHKESKLKDAANKGAEALRKLRAA